MTPLTSHLNGLADKYFSFNPLPAETLPAEDRLFSPSNLQDLAIGAIFKHMQVRLLTLEHLQNIPKGLQDEIILRAHRFTDVATVKEFLTDETAKQLLTRFKLSRKLLESGTDREILLRRIFEEVLSKSTPEEKAEIIRKKRSLFTVTHSTYSFINTTEKAQVIIGKILNSQLAKTLLTLLVLVTTVVALFTFYRVKPHIVIGIFNCIPRALNAMQPYRHFSLLLSIFSGAMFYIGRIRRFPVPRIYKIILISTSLFILIPTSLFWICAQISAFTGLPCSTVAWAFITQNHLPLFLFYVAPIYIVSTMAHTVDSSTSFASRTLTAASEKLTNWRCARELQEARDLWIHSLLDSTPSQVV